MQKRTVKVGYRTLEFSEVLGGVSEGDRVVVSDQDKLRPGQLVRQRMIKARAAPERRRVTPPLYIALRFLFHRKRAFILSLCGVVFGVAIFICTQAQTQGFTKHFIDSTLGSNGAIMLRAQFQSALRQPVRRAEKRRTSKQRVAAISRGSPTRPKSCASAGSFPNVVACAPVLRGTLTRAGRI